MNVHVLTAAPPPDLASALARFESQFTYPLGPGRTFRISHGDDYPRFYRAIGDAACFVAERDGEVLGVLGLAITTISVAGVCDPGPASQRPATEDRQRPVLYLGDLKVAPAARGGRALVRLVEASRSWWSRADCAFGVVMDGTPVTPVAYTGRLGIPPFCEVAKVAVLRLPAAPGSFAGWEAVAAAGAECFARLAADRVRTPGGDPAIRSVTTPVWLVAPDGSACGRLEDTRSAKRLIADDRSEMMSVHLSCIGYRNPAALAELVRVACAVAAERGFPAVFAAVPPEHADTTGPGVVVAPATVFATALEPGLSWAVNTAEI